MEGAEGWDVVSGPGITALGLAAARAVESGAPDRLIADPFEVAFLEAIDSPVPFPVRWPDPGAEVSVQQALFLHGSRYIGVRSRHYDDYLLAACADRIHQVVVLAVGLDVRAFRLPWPPGVRLFEIDQPQVLAFKDHVLHARDARPTCARTVVGADLRADWPNHLVEAGFDPDASTVWLAEGLLAYLPADAEADLISAIQRLSAPGSQLALDRIVTGPANEEGLARLSSRSGIDMAGLIDIESRADVPTLLRARGWVVTEEMTSALAARYGRDLTDPFASGSEDSASPPWLNTSFLAARRS